MNEEKLLIELIKDIKTGTAFEVKDAQKQLEKYWRKFDYEFHNKRNNEFSIYIDELNYFDQIEDDDHKAYFINSLKWVIMATDDNHFEKWVDFFILQIQNPSGKVRQAVLNAVDWLIIAIALDIKWLPNSDHKIKSEQERQIRINKKRFGHFTFRIEELIDKYHEPKYNRYKYISSMPAGIYKSLQKMLMEHLLRSELYENEYKSYLNNNFPISCNDNLSRNNFISDRQEIEKDLTNLLKTHNSELDLDYIKKIIYNENGQDDLTKIIVIFDRGRPDELQNILDLIMDAWNYFPHKKLGGKSPMKMI